MCGVYKVLGIEGSICLFYVCQNMPTNGMLSLWSIDVEAILYFQGGYRGFYAQNTLPLTPKVVNNIHKRGGTILGISCGSRDTSKIVNSIQKRGINRVYIWRRWNSQRGVSDFQGN